MDFLEKLLGRRGEKKSEPQQLSAKEKLHSTFQQDDDKDREDLFATKVLSIKPPGWFGKQIAVFSRDPGSARALIPVIRQLQESRVAITAVVDGRAQEDIQKEFPNAADITPERSILDLGSVMNPSLIVTDTSTSERGLETNAASMFKGIPIVLVEDAYSTTNGYLQRLKDMGRTLPARVCVMDSFARDRVLERFPELGNSVRVTGQPANDRLADEKTSEIRERTRSQLGIGENDKLITYMGTSGQLKDMEKTLPKVKKGIEASEKTGNKVYFAFRRHPRDNASAKDYISATEAAGLTPIETDALPTSDVNAASDVVMTNWSTEGISAAFRRIPVLYVNDLSIRKPPGSITYPLPPVVMGASASAIDLSDIPALLSSLLEPESETSKTMRANMEANFKADGKSAERVAQVIRDLL